MMGADSSASAQRVSQSLSLPRPSFGQPAMWSTWSASGSSRPPQSGQQHGQRRACSGGGRRRAQVQHVGDVVTWSEDFALGIALVGCNAALGVLERRGGALLAAARAGAGVRVVVGADSTGLGRLNPPGADLTSPAAVVRGAVGRTGTCVMGGCVAGLPRCAVLAAVLNSDSSSSASSHLRIFSTFCALGVQLRPVPVRKPVCDGASAADPAFAAAGPGSSEQRKRLAASSSSALITVGFPEADANIPLQTCSAPAFPAEAMPAPRSRARSVRAKGRYLYGALRCTCPLY